MSREQRYPITKAYVAGRQTLLELIALTNRLKTIEAFVDIRINAENKDMSNNMLAMIFALQEDKIRLQQAYFITNKRLEMFMIEKSDNFHDAAF